MKIYINIVKMEDSSNDPSEILNLLLNNKNKDLIIHLLGTLDDKTVLSVCGVNKEINELCKSSRAETMWKNRVIRRFYPNEKDIEDVALSKGNKKNKGNKNKGTWRQYFLDLLYLDETFTPEKALEKAAERGSVDLVKFFLNKITYFQNGKQVLRAAAKSGNRELVEFIIKTNLLDSESYMTWGMEGSAQGGHKDLVNFFIDQGAKNWSRGLVAAAEGGHIDLVKFFMDKIYKKNKDEGRDEEYIKQLLEMELGIALEAAAEGGHKKMVEFLIEKGANQWDRGLRGAAFSGDEYLIHLFIVKGKRKGDLELLWNNGMLGAAQGGHIDLVKYFVKKNKSGNIWWITGMKAAANGGHKELAEYFIVNGNIKLKGMLKTGLEEAIEGGHKDTIKYFQDKMKE